VKSAKLYLFIDLKEEIKNSTILYFKIYIYINTRLVNHDRSESFSIFERASAKNKIRKRNGTREKEREEKTRT